jgi:AraC-like DNA-binding protein
MQTKLLEYLGQISEEEQKILDGSSDVEKHIYSNTTEFIVDSRKMLRRRQFIDIRPHTRFIHFPEHSHNYIEIVYVCSGNMIHIINGVTRITMERGELLFLNRNAKHEILPCGKEDIAVNILALPEFFEQTFETVRDSSLLFNFVFANGGKAMDESSYIHFRTGDVLPVQNLAENIIWGVVNKQNYKRSINHSTMGLLILHLLNHTDNINRDDPHQYEQNIVINVLKYIDENYRTARLEEFSTEQGLPPYYLSKIIKKYLGSGYKQLLQQRRLEQAVQLLTQTRMSVEEISLAVGYENNSYFHRLFREKYDVTPYGFRKRDVSGLGETEGM